MKKVLIIIAALVIMGVAVYWWLSRNSLVAPSPEESNIQVQGQSQANDSVSAINSDLNGVEVGDIENDFQAIDNELNNL